MTLRDDLIAAKALIDTPEKWTKGIFRDNAGCFCMLGAVAQVIDHEPTKSWIGYPNTIAQLLEDELPRGFFSIAAFNDNSRTTHADVMAVFDRAIEAAS